MSSYPMRLEHIRADAQLQPRVTMSPVVIEDYAESMRAGADFPPIVVFFDGETYWLADGFHRFYAASAAGLEWLPCDVRDGSRRDALLFSVGTNAEHGLRRSSGDKRRAVLALVNDPEWARLTNGELAALAHVSLRLVEALNPSSARAEDANAVREVTRNGVTYPMHVRNIGRDVTVRPYEPTPAEHAPLNGVFRAAGVPDPEVAALLAGPAPEPPERAALRQVIYAAHLTRFDPLAVAASADGEDAAIHARGVAGLARWLGELAAALAAPHPAYPHAVTSPWEVES